MAKTIHMVIPCYNEEQVLPKTIKVLTGLYEDFMNKKLILPDSKIVFVNDGSSDRTWEIIERESGLNSRIAGISLTSNCGHQYALLAGLSYANKTADAVITMDADLQDDVNVIEQFITKFYEGFEIVYGVRSSRKTDSFFKRTTAQAFYKFQNTMGIKTIYNHADFRLMSKRAINSLEKYEESNLYLRGIIPSLGYKSDKVYFERKEREAGTTKYSIRKMLGLAINGITSFSMKPIRFISWLGIFFFLLGILMTIYYVILYMHSGLVPGWASIICTLWILGGTLMLSLGIIGEYTGKIYLEVKRRPRYEYDKIVGLEKEEV